MPQKIRVSTDKLSVECVCGYSNLVHDLDSIESEVILNCNGCGRNIMVVIAVSVEDVAGSWIN